jgi:Cys-rich protein (TIGR01571 family)
MNSVGLLTVAAALVTVYMFALLNAIIFPNWAASYAGPFTWCLFLYYRHKLREKFNLNAWSCSTCCIDVLYTLCCPWCAISQEARVAANYLQKG